MIRSQISTFFAYSFIILCTRSPDMAPFRVGNRGPFFLFGEVRMGKIVDHVIIEFIDYKQGSLLFIFSPYSQEPNPLPWVMIGFKI